ncbi:GTPase-associated system all-helical protein GASH [Nannocystis sp. SCPEA4]|uniref:GTPase-associated system all-helical protein GASH n=1 Tax=Nannocystis sp. SCPEA4 TaxID=2996787 RepID=UPI00226FD392|nr:GTPase-associated system all-helical protein GASH [Nannocystis sp. SCPEA4]MCY1055741.1 GTPase-associated system all-helical protein GASH [Nannocystis sp. SCPEA4]
MTEFLSEGLIEKLDGDDSRFEKLEKAASAVAKELRTKPRLLIGAILAGLNPDVPPTDPAIARAEQALNAVWKAMRSVHTSTPVGLLRAILLEACFQAGEAKNAAVVWLTAADTLPLMRVGRGEAAICRMLETLAERTEQVALAQPAMPAGPGVNAVKFELRANATASPAARQTDRNQLLMRVATAAGPNHPHISVNSPNPYWPNQGQHWSHEFTPRMSAALADELDALSNAFAQSQVELAKRIQASLGEPLKEFNAALTEQQRWLHHALAASKAHGQAEQLRLNILWWAEAMYSPSLRRGYRELPPPIAAVAMALDILEQVTSPAPASAAYLLAETVNRLPGAEFARQIALPDLLGLLHNASSQLSAGWLNRLGARPNEGHLSLRDLVISSITGRDGNLAESMKRAGLGAELALSLPILARALFRQEQAVRLAGERS